MKQNKIDRRNFLKKTATITAGGILAPTIIPGSVLGKNGRISASNQITLGMIGMGNMGTNNIDQFFQMDDVRVLAVCDLDAVRLKKAKVMVDMAYDNQDCDTYHDFRELLHRPDIDEGPLRTTAPGRVEGRQQEFDRHTEPARTAGCQFRR